jgi:hypothetical protein
MNANDDVSLIELSNPPSKRYLRDRIDRLAISADSKALLYDLADITVDVGGKVVSAGRQILAFVLDLVKRFPNTAFGVIVALVVSSLIGAIPLFGVVLGPLLTPLLVAFGLASGALADLQEGAIRSRVSQLERHFMTTTGAR